MTMDTDSELHWLSKSAYPVDSESEVEKEVSNQTH